MQDWTQAIGPLSDPARAALTALPAAALPQGTQLFSPGATAQGFPVILSGRVDVTLITAGGREILLYAVEPGQSCIQSTLGLMGGEGYSATATAITDLRAIIIPKPVFLRLLNDEAPFRAFVLRVFGQRMSDLTRLLEQVAFGSVEARLAAALLDMEVDGSVRATQAALAARIGTAREVVSRRLEAWAAAGLLVTGRGSLRLIDRDALRRIADNMAM
jgi:CRP/FNR family transcriptional regulator